MRAKRPTSQWIDTFRVLTFKLRSQDLSLQQVDTAKISWPRFDLKGTWDLPTNVAPSTPMHLRNRASQGRRQTLLVQKKRLFKCPFLLQSTSWLTVRFLLDYNTSSNFWIKIWSNFADFIKEESFCRQQSFDLAIMYEINEGVFFTSVECDSMYVRCVGSYISMNNV